MEEKETGSVTEESDNGLVTKKTEAFIPRDQSYSSFLNRQTTERKKLLEVAIKFLINPRVIGSSSEDKTTFLKKKGLNEEEIYWVTREAAARNINNTIASSPSLPPPPPPSRPLVLQPAPATHTWGRIIVRGIVVGSMVSLLVYWIKSIVSKWTHNQRIQIERQRALENQVNEMKTTLETTISELKDTTLAIKTLLETQSKEITRLSSIEKEQFSSGVTEGALQAINSELSTVKGLLLNRHQFPTPQKSTSNTSGIPSWQRSTAVEETSDTNTTPTTPPPQPVAAVSDEEVIDNN